MTEYKEFLVLIFKIKKGYEKNQVPFRNPYDCSKHKFAQFLF